MGSKEAEGWVAERALEILKGEAESVASGMRHSAKEKQKTVEGEALEKVA